MTSVVCKKCGKVFSVVSGLPSGECSHCKHLQSIPKTAAGKAARLSGAAAALGTKRQTGAKPTTGNAAVDSMLKSQLENSKRKAEAAQDEERVMKRTQKS